MPAHGLGQQVRKAFLVVERVFHTYVFIFTRWVDYSDKYGFGYALSDESIGVLFNDITKLLQLSDGKYVLGMLFSKNLFLLFFSLQ